MTEETKNDKAKSNKAAMNRRARGLERQAKIRAVAKQWIDQPDSALENFSLYEIAKMAEIPPSSLYHFYPKPEALIDDLVLEAGDELSHNILDAVHSQKIVNWRQVVGIYVETIANFFRNSPYARKIVLERLLPPKMAVEYAMQEADRDLALFSRYFVLPELPSERHVFAFAELISIRVIAAGFQIDGEITKATEEESQLATESYLANYLPRYLPLRERQES